MAMVPHISVKLLDYASRVKINFIILISCYKFQKYSSSIISNLSECHVECRLFAAATFIPSGMTIISMFKPVVPPCSLLPPHENHTVIIIIQVSGFACWFYIPLGFIWPIN